MKNLILILLLPIFLFSCVDKNEINYGTVEGNVYSMDNEPIANLELKLSNIASTETDNLGYFIFENILPGNYTISVYYELKEVYSKDIEIAQGETINMNVYVDLSSNSNNFTDVTGSWYFSSSDLSNDDFIANLSFDIDMIQTTIPYQGSSNSVVVTGSFSDFSWMLQRKSDNSLYIYPSMYGEIVDGGINTAIPSHNFDFCMGEQYASIWLWNRGVTSNFESIWGNITLKLDLADLYGLEDGVVTLEGTWDMERQ
jgi:hypothetical protein